MIDIDNSSEENDIFFLYQLPRNEKILGAKSSPMASKKVRNASYSVVCTASYIIIIT